MEADRIGPVVEYLAAMEVAADTPAVLVALVQHLHMPHADIVEVAALERHMVQARGRCADDRQGMVVGPLWPLVQVHEGGQHLGLVTTMDQLGRLHAEVLAVPLDQLPGGRREDRQMAEALHVRRTVLGSLVTAEAVLRVRIVPIDRRATARQGLQALGRANELQPAAIRVEGMEILAAPGMRAVLDLGTETGGELHQGLLAGDAKSHADKGGLALAGDIGKRCIAIAAQIEGIPLLRSIQQAVIEHELADCRQIGVAEDHVFDIVDKHCSLLGDAQV